MYITFFSYDRHDNRCFDGRVVEYVSQIDKCLQVMLGTRGSAIFVDVDSLEFSVEWWSEIEDVINDISVINAISVFLPVVSPGWLKRLKCREEYELFIERERKITATAGWPRNTRLIIPLILANPLPEQESDEIWQDLRNIHNPQSIMPFVDHPVKLASEAAGDLARKIADRIRDLHLLVKSQTGDVVVQTREQADKFTACLRAYSAALADWPSTLGNNQWLERDELNCLLRVVETNESSTHFVVGKPGTGKSALLSTLYRRIVENGIVCLGIKADVLPASISSLDDLSKHVLGEDMDLAGLLCELALRQKVVVIIDQLDALADLVDLHSGRLNVLLDLIARIRDSHGIHLVASVREFELTFDKRLGSLISDADDRKNERIDLEGFTREQVVGVLHDGFDIDATHWPEDHLAFLETPYHLAQFTRHFAALTGGSEAIPHEQYFESIQKAHRCTYEVTVALSKNREALDAILNKLAERTEQTEELWHLLEQLKIGEHDDASVEELEGLRWVYRQTDGRLGFAHQTQYEFVLGKRFVDSPGDFVNYVKLRQDGLFVRPVVWHALALMRAENRTNYEQAMAQLLARVERRHLQRLFIEFLAEVADPTDAEIKWVVGLLESPEQSPRMCWLLRGKRGWFEKLPDSILDKLMCQPPDKAWPVCRLIETSWKLENPRTLHLIRRTWAFHHDYADQTWFALSQAPKFDEEMFTWLMHCASLRVEDDVWYLNKCLETLCADRPDWAYSLLALILARRIDQKSNDRADWSWLPDEDLLHAAKEQASLEVAQSKRVEEKLGRNRWYGVEKLAEKDPIAFVQSIWSWFLTAMKLCGARYRSRLLTYRVESDNHGWFGDDPWPGSHLVIAIDNSLGVWARTDRAGFFRFASENNNVDSMTVQQMFARALTPIAHLEPSFVLAFFRDDNRRFLLDGYHRRRETNSLLNAVIPYLSKDQVTELQQIVLEWQMYRDEGEPSFIDRSRADLLYNIPGHLRLPKANELVERNRKALEREAERYRNNNDFESDSARPKLSSKTMLEMSNGDLLKLLREKITSLQALDSRYSDWDMQEITHEFHEFVKTDPARGAALATILTLPSEGGLAGTAVRGLVKSKYDSSQILDLVRHLASSNYDNRDFQDDVGQALRDLADSEKGLPDDILDMLTDWLLARPIEVDSENANSTSPIQIKRNSAEEAVSVLWPSVELGDFYPHKWFFIGEAIKLGYCCRPEPNVTTWFEVYSAAVNLPFPAEVWRSWIFELVHYCPDPQFAAKLFTQLVKSRTDVMESELGLYAVAKFGSWIETESRNEYLSSMIQSQSPRIQQGAGELAVILQLRDKDRLSKDLIDIELANGDRDNPLPFRLGVAFAAGNTWRWEGMQQQALEFMRSLLPSESHDINDAVLEAFHVRQDLADDPSTRDLLTLIAETLTFRKTRDVFPLVECLKNYVRLNPELTFRVMRRIVDGFQQIKQEQALSRINLYEDDFINIVLTIHRQHSSSQLRKDSLTLYEDLLDLEIAGVFKSLRMLDQRPQ